MRPPYEHRRQSDPPTVTEATDIMSQVGGVPLTIPDDAVTRREHVNVVSEIRDEVDFLRLKLREQHQALREQYWALRDIAEVVWLAVERARRSWRRK